MKQKGVQRFYQKNFLATAKYTLVDKDIIHQCNKVLRVIPWDLVVFFDGIDLIDHLYEIVCISQKQMELMHIKDIEKEKQSRNINLFQAYPNKLGKMELIVQKNTEIWIEKIVFFLSEYSQNTLFINDKKISRLEKIAIEACEQSNNNIIPKLVFEKILDFSTMIPSNTLCFHTQWENALKLAEVSQDMGQNISILVWPEWWFSEREILTLWEQDVKMIWLGENILRSETVAMVVNFYFQHIS